VTVLEIMERVGSRRPNRVIAYINDAFSEIESLIPERTTGYMIDVTTDTRLYALPSNLVKLLGVYRKSSTDGSYIRIAHVNNIDLIDGISSTVTVDTTDILVV
jgi:hypothetical protein